MGFITNQWLQGDPERNRSWLPIKVFVSVYSSSDTWTKQNGVLREISCVRYDSEDYQKLLFTQKDVDLITVSFVSAISADVSEIVATSALANLSDSALMKIVGKELSLRASLKNE